MGTSTIAQKYASMIFDREPYLNRARDCSKLSIPSLIPPSGSTGHDKFPTPYQGVGARGVNNLASKLLLALLPANTPFFRLAIDDFTLEELAQVEGARAEVEEALNRIERSVQSEIETSGIRVSSFEAMKHLVVAGNTLMFLMPSGGVRLYRLDNYAVRRDPSGSVLEIITVEHISPSMLPEGLAKVTASEPTVGGKEGNVAVYTYICRKDGKWYSEQEVNGVIVEGSQGTYPLGKCPWIPLRFTKVDGEHYGRSYFEEYLGDVRTLEALTKAMTEGAVAAAKVLFFVKANGTTSMMALRDTPNMGIAVGSADDVSTLRLDKFNDFRVAMEQSNKVEDRLNYAFLMNSAVQRAGERVTAEEIRFMANELEDTLGGIYSILSQEMQLPIVSALMHRMELDGKLPALPAGTVQPQITAGMEALGRGHDLSKLASLLQQITPLASFAGEQLGDYINVGDYIKRAGTALGIDMKGLVNSEDAVTKLRQDRQMQQMMSQMAPNMLPAQQGMPEE
jgi:hypothetical protein